MLIGWLMGGQVAQDLPSTGSKKWVFSPPSQTSDRGLLIVVGLLMKIRTAVEIDVRKTICQTIVLMWWRL